VPSTRRFVRVVAGSVCLLLAGVAGGCGEDAPDLSKFVGTWKVEAGTANPNCGDNVPVPPFDLKDETVTITTATDAHLVATIRSCALKFNVNGDLASVLPNQTCTFQYTATDMAGRSMDLSANLAASSGNLTFMGTTADVVLAGTATVPFFGSLSLTCQFNLNAKVNKL
jgi:hypothetical protein